MNANLRCSSIPDPSRRRFLQAAGVATASLVCTAEGLGPRPAVAAPPAPVAQVPPKPTPLKLGLASYSCRKYDLDQTLAIAHRVGLSHICLKSMHLPLESKPEEIAAAVAKVKAAGICLYGCGVVSMHKPEEIQQALDYAKAAGMTTIVAMITPQMLPELAKMIPSYDIRIAIHNHGPGDKIWPTPQSAYEKIQDLDPRIGLCIDIGHTVRAGADLIQSAAKYADRLFDIHMKDVTAATPKGRSCPVGRGVIDIPRFLKTLIKVKYAGVVSFEYEDDPDDVLPGLAESVGYTRGVLAADCT
jgi:sugar phosphate isomerase/epimerase